MEQRKCTPSFGLWLVDKFRTILKKPIMSNIHFAVEKNVKQMLTCVKEDTRDNRKEIVKLLYVGTTADLYGS